MKRDARLSSVLHVLLHLAEQDGPVTSEVLARALHTNPVVVRRILSGLRNQGHVRSDKGHGGGWTLARDPSTLTLRAVHEALGAPSLLAIGGRTEAPGCLVEAAVNDALESVARDAESLLLARLGEVSLATLQRDVRRRQRRRGTVNHLEGAHG